MISETCCCAKHIKYTHNFAHMNTVSSHLHRFSKKRPLWWWGATYRGALIELFLFQGGLLEGALKRGWALNRGFTVVTYFWPNFKYVNYITNTTDIFSI